jgi:hypothetical protein
VWLIRLDVVYGSPAFCCSIFILYINCDIPVWTAG